MPIFILCFYLIGSVFATDSNIEGTVHDVANNLDGNVTAVKNFVSQTKGDFLGSQWKEFLLKNKVISGFDTFFTKANLFFVVFLGMNWSFSFQIIFSILLWIFTLLSIIEYFPSKSFIRWIYSLIIIIFVAFIGFFRYFGEFSSSLVFRASSLYLSFIIVIFLVFLVVLWYFLNKFISKNIKTSIKMKRESIATLEQKKTRAVLKGINQATGEF